MSVKEEEGDDGKREEEEKEENDDELSPCSGVIVSCRLMDTLSTTVA